ncbi:hypothetical protein EAF00_000577 [Botryotinia globosa]|nr:hypothetical protein EAF00_000577 [Botryotinia globosa]
MYKLSSFLPIQRSFLNCTRYRSAFDASKLHFFNQKISVAAHLHQQQIPSRLVLAEKLPGPDPSCKVTLICTSLYLAKGSSKVDDVDAGLWAAIELNTWVLVASIPTFKPIIVKILKDRKARQAAASGNHADYSKSISINKGYKRSKGSSSPSTTSGDQLDLVERCAIRENSSQNEMELYVRG